MASIDKRPNGQWRARWREYPGGPQKTKHFVRKVDADQYLVKVQHDLMTGAYVDPPKSRTTLEDYWKVWAPRQPWRQSSRDSIASMARNHLLPALGDRPLGSIRLGDVESWAARLELGGQTARLAVQYLGTMLESAVADGLLATNPAHHAKRPRVDREPVVPFTAAQLDALSGKAPAWFRVASRSGRRAGCARARRPA